MSFNGIVSGIGNVLDYTRYKSGATAVINIPTENYIKVGSSVCCSGVCLTATESNSNIINVDLSEETLNRTNLINWNYGVKFNFETPVRMGDQINGHLIQGHVDCEIEITNIIKQGNDHILEFLIPPKYQSFILEKCSIALDGVSMTVNNILNKNNTFCVNVIPHTWSSTTFQYNNIGDKVNAEFDLMIKINQIKIS